MRVCGQGTQAALDLAQNAFQDEALAKQAGVPAPTEWVHCFAVVRPKRLAPWSSSRIGLLNRTSWPAKAGMFASMCIGWARE